MISSLGRARGGAPTQLFELAAVAVERDAVDARVRVELSRV
jgi:hypothetical protein